MQICRCWMNRVCRSWQRVFIITHQYPPHMRSILDASEFFLQPILGEFIQFAYLIGPGQIGLALQRSLGAGIHDLQFHLAIAWRIEYEAHWIRDTIVRVDHLVAVDNIARLVTGQLFLQIVNCDLVQELVDTDQLLFSVHFHCFRVMRQRQKGENVNWKRKTVRIPCAWWFSVFMFSFFCFVSNANKQTCNYQ